MAATTGAVTFNAAGIYKVSYSVQATPTSMMGSPISLAFSLFLNGTYVSGSTFAGLLSMPISETIGYNICGEVYVTIAAGQTLTLASSSVDTMQLTSVSAGSTAPVSSASMDIVLIQAM
jgi:hypothetical protein